MEKEIRGLSNIQMPIIKSMLPVQLSKYAIRLGFCETFHNSLDDADFLLVDGTKFLEEDHDSLYVQDLIDVGKPVYAMLLNKSYKQKLEILNRKVLDCFDYPIMSDILSKTIRNQIHRYVAIPTQQIIKDSSYVYRVRTDNFTTKSLSIEFMPSKTNQWFLRYRDNAISVSRFEKRIIEYLMTSKKLASKREIAYVAWNKFEIRDNTITVTIKKIRDIFHKLKMPVRIKNLYGYGYSVDILR